MRKAITLAGLIAGGIILSGCGDPSTAQDATAFLNSIDIQTTGCIYESGHGAGAEYSEFTCYNYRDDMQIKYSIQCVDHQCYLAKTHTEKVSLYR